MKRDIETAIQAAVKDLFHVESEAVLTRPEEQFGDYATNISLQLAKTTGQKPKDIGEALATTLRETLKDTVSDINIAGPGFLNFTLRDESLLAYVQAPAEKPLVKQTVLVEFGDPNPFKAMHLGHLYSAIVGDAIARLFEASGAGVKRLSYHGDVGLHVAKALWAIQRHLQQTPNTDLADVFKDDTTIGQFYAEGATAYENDPAAAEAIRDINAQVYTRDDEAINQLYDGGRDLSFSYFDKVFQELGISYDKRYLESDTTDIALETVKAHVGTVFETSDGAVVYRGEKQGLHTRVFINSRGLPTYEAKDLGLAELKKRDFPEASQSIIITAHEQAEYFKVMLAALSEIDPELRKKTRHLAHGFLSLTTGKMSSRSGNVYAASDLLESVHEAVRHQFPDSEVQRDVYLAAVKYAFLKNRLGGDMVFNVDESVALDGNSGPYLQYAHARARSLLAKATPHPVTSPIILDGSERSLLRKITEFSEVVTKATTELMPHYTCTYLYELAQSFNHFYEHSRVVGDPREHLRLPLVQAYADVLGSGLSLLGIPAPAKM